MPKKSGDRVTTDRRDARQLARLARSGALTAVSVPKVDEEAMRERPRAREDASSDLQDAQLRLTAFVLSHDLRDVGRAHWGLAPGECSCLERTSERGNRTLILHKHPYEQ